MSSEDEVISVLARSQPVHALPHLIAALKRESQPVSDFRDWAIGLDSNVLLNLAKGRKGADLVDYFVNLHEGPIILPAQSIQEFWNNRIYAVSGLADQVRAKFFELEKLVKQIDPEFRVFGGQLEGVLAEFKQAFGHVLDENTSLEVNSLLDALLVRAEHPEINRERLPAIAAQRKLAKTPPGFRDDGDGDFLIWSDFLLGLADASSRGHHFVAAALVTDDVKKDWSTKGTTNPILAAEVECLVGVPFRTLTLSQFNELLSRQLASAEPTPGTAAPEESE